MPKQGEVLKKIPNKVIIMNRIDELVILKFVDTLQLLKVVLSQSIFRMIHMLIQNFLLH